jgi:hypothetical protein
MKSSYRFIFFLAVWPFCIPVQASDAPEAKPVTATIETTLSTAPGITPRPIRQFAFDGDPHTFFASEQNPGVSEHFTLVFEKPVALKSIALTTGRPDGTDDLGPGLLEYSADGKEFGLLANITAGSLRAESKISEVRAIRIRPAKDLGHPLAIRELSIESDPPVATFAYPVEFIVDVTDAPEMKEWAEKVAAECVRFYPMINEELKTDGYKPPHLVTMKLSSNYNGVAAAGGGRITGSVKFFKDHPDDVGAMIHETTHIVQRYRSRSNPGWLVEGVADYVRFFKYEPGKIGPINAERAHYNRSYRVTAAFLAYVTENYDKQLVLKLNKLMREGQYKEDVFKELTGKTLPELDEEWRATLRP